MSENKEWYLTPEGAEKLKAELEHLIQVRRPELAQRLRHAISQGDLSENADYIAAKEEQAFLEGKIQELQTLLREAQIVENVSNGVVNLGSRVRLRFVPEGEEVTYTLVGLKEANPRQGKISHESPIGKALMGKKAGQIGMAETPAGTIQFEIIDVF